jgi:hypothetical protein
MARVRQADFGGTRFQGSARSNDSGPVQTRSSSLTNRGKKEQLLQEQDVKNQEIRREEATANIFLEAQQKLVRSQLEKDSQEQKWDLQNAQDLEKNLLESKQELSTASQKLTHQNILDDLKRQEIVQSYQFKNQSQGLQDSQSLAQSILGNNQKNQADVLSFKQSNQSNRLRTEAALQNSNTELLSSSISSILQFGGSVVEYGVKKNDWQQKEKKDKTTIDNTFDLPGNPGSSGKFDGVISAEQEYDKVEPRLLMSTEDAIQSSTDDPVVRAQLRVDNTPLYGQVSRSSAVAAANDFQTYFGAYVNDRERHYARPDGSKFNARTPNLSRNDIEIIKTQAKRSFYKDAGLANIRPSEVASTIVPVVNNTANSWGTTALTNSVAGAAADRVRDATYDINKNLEAQKDLQFVFDHGASSLYSSGGYTTAEKGKANEDTTKEILKFAVRQDREDIIDALEKVEIKPGSTLVGTFPELFYDARKDRISDSVTARRNADAMDSFRLDQISRDRKLQLADENTTPQDEVRINLEAADAFDALETAEGKLKAAQLRSNPNYSPFTFFDLQRQQQVEGITHTHDALEELVDSREITMEEAQKLGFDPKTGVSADTRVQKQVKEFDSDMKSQGNAIVLDALDKLGDAKGGVDKKLVMETRGNSIANDIKDRLSQKLFRYIRDNEGQVDSGDIRDFIKNESDKIRGEVTYSIGDGETAAGFSYTMGGPKMDKLKVSRFNDATKVWGYDYIDQSPVDLRNNRDIVRPRRDTIISRRELERAQIALASGEPVSSSIREKAAAIGINVSSLIEAQRIHYNAEKVEEFVKPQGAQSLLTSPSYTRGEFDTEKTINGVNVDAFRYALIGQESGGDPGARNRRTNASGLGQILPSNIPNWSRDVLGYSLSYRQFMSSPKLQVQIINGKLIEMLQGQAAKGYTGAELLRRVAAQWYGGQGGIKHWDNPHYHDHIPGEPNMQQYTTQIYERYSQ